MEIPRFNDPEDIARRFEREQRGVLRKREEELSESLAPYRVGSVPYLNAVPLTRGLESEIVFATPSKLAEMLQRDELDAALVSVTEVLFNDRYGLNRVYYHEEADAFYFASEAKSLLSVLDNRHDTTYRLYQSKTATKYMNP